MKPIVFFILGVLAVLALGAFQAPPAPVRYEVLTPSMPLGLERDLNRSAEKGCRFVHLASPFSPDRVRVFVVMECPAGE